MARAHDRSIASGLRRIDQGHSAPEAAVSRVAKSVTVQASPDDVIEYIADVRNHPAFIGPLKAVDNVQGDPREPGTSWNWTFIMGGVELVGDAETVAYEPARRFSYRTTSGALSTFVYSAQRDGAGTRVSLEVDYELPHTALGRMEAAVLEKLNDSDAQRAVDNLKVILDG
jgi:uncharacterized membrane protein